jgi:hypothetical protein
MLLYRRAGSLKRFLALYRYRFSTHDPILSLVSCPSFNRRQSKARHSKALGNCVLRDGRLNRDATLATLCSEMILLTFMLAGLVRQRDHYLGRLLFHHVITAFSWVSRAMRIADMLRRRAWSGYSWLYLLKFRFL